MRETAPTEAELRIATIEARQTTLGAEGWQVPSVTGGHTLSVGAQDLLYADVPWLIAELRAARKQIETLSTPDIISVEGCTFYGEEDFSGAVEIPNTYRECDWANRTLGPWCVASVVTEWDADGDPVEEETRVYMTAAEARAAIAESEANRSSSSLSSEPRNG